MSKFPADIPVGFSKNLIIPQYYTADDGPWLANLLRAFNQFEGRPRDHWRQFLADGLNFRMPYAKGRFAAQVIEKELSEAVEPLANMTKIKTEVFVMAAEVRRKFEKQFFASSGEFRSLVIEAVLKGNSTISLAQFEKSLIEGSDRQAILKSPSVLGSFSALPAMLNGALVQKIIMRSYVIEIIVADQCRRLIRQAKLRGLVCEIFRDEGQMVRLRISGPLAIFGPTTIYGRRLQEFIPLLFWNLNFKLRATCRSNESSYFLYLDSSSPLKVSAPPRLFDSRVEEQFYSEFGKYTQAWELHREPAPFVDGDRMFFPDFLATRRGLYAHSVYIEILGYWTDDYIKKKIEDIDRMKKYRAVFLISHKLKEHFHASCENHRFVFMKRKIPLSEILLSIEELANFNSAGG